MSKHLKAFLEQEFKSFIPGYLETEQNSLRSIEEPLEEHLTQAFNEYIQEEMSVKHMLANFLAQNDAMDDKEHLQDRLTYWENGEGPEDDEERTAQINGIKLLIKGCS